MRNLLFLPAHPDGELHWMQLQANGHLVSKRKFLLGEQSADELHNQSVIAVLPGSKVSTYRIAMPKVKGSAQQAAVAFAVEGLCAQPIDELAVLPGEYHDGMQTTAVVEKTYLSAMLIYLKEQRIKVRSITVDYLCLAPVEDDQWRVAQLDDYIIWRMPHGIGASVHKDLWPVVLSQAVAALDKPVTLFVFQPALAQESFMPPVGDLCQLDNYHADSWVDKQAVLQTAGFVFNIASSKLRLYAQTKQRSRRLAIVAVITSVFLALSMQIGFSVVSTYLLKKGQQQISQTLASYGLENVTLDQARVRLQQVKRYAVVIDRANTFLTTMHQVSQVLSSAQMALCQAVSYRSRVLMLAVPVKQINVIMSTLKKGLKNYRVQLAPENKKLKQKQVATKASSSLKNISIEYLGGGV